MGLQHLDMMRPQEFMNGVVRIFEIGELPRAGGASFAARCGQAFGDAVVAERAFFRGIRFWIQKAAAVWARLNAIAAADAVFFVNEDNAVRGNESSADRTHLRAGRIS